MKRTKSNAVFALQMDRSTVRVKENIITSLWRSRKGGQVGGDVEYCGGAKRPKTTTVHWSIESLLVLQTCLGPTITFCNVGAITLLLTCGARCESMGNIEERRALLLSSHGIPLQTYKET